MLSKHLQSYGLVNWFSSVISDNISHLPWFIGLFTIAIIYFYSHYFLASISTHVTAMYPALLALSLKIGSPSILAVFILAFVSNLFASLTHFGSTTAVIYAGARLVPINIWWRVGFIASLINIAIWGFIGTFWWKLIGIF
jgi:DASS family divalent anion:Na+ symporter